MDKKKKVIKKKPAKKTVKKTKKNNRSSIKSTKDKSVKVNVNVNASGGSGSGGGGGTSIPPSIPQFVYQSQRDRGEDDLINKFNNLLNKVGSKPPSEKIDPNNEIKDDAREFNKKVNQGATRNNNNPIFTEESNNIQIVRKRDLSNQTLMENINTPKTDDDAREVNVPAVDKIAEYINEPNLMAEESNNIQIVRKPDLSNQTLLENINTPKTDGIQLQVNEPDVDEMNQIY